MAEQTFQQITNDQVFSFVLRTQGPDGLWPGEMSGHCKFYLEHLGALGSAALARIPPDVISIVPPYMRMPI